MSIFGNSTDMESWDMASSQMMQMAAIQEEKRRYQEATRRHGQELALKQLMARNDLNQSQKQMILQEAQAGSQLTSEFEARNQASAQNRMGLEQQMKTDRIQSALGTGVLKGMQGSGQQTQQQKKPSDNDDSLFSTISSLFSK